MLKYVLLEDNVHSLLYFTKTLNVIFDEHGLDAKIALKTSNPHEVINYSNRVGEDDWHVYLLDISLESDLTGMDVAEIIRRKDTKSYTVFLTAHSEYAMSSFRVKTFDFLVKPVTRSVLTETILALHNDHNNLLRAVDGTHATLSVSSNGVTYLLNSQDILFIEKQRKVLVIHTEDEIIECYGILKDMEEELANRSFFRTHCSYIVNLDKVRQVDNQTNTILLSNGARCLISRSRKRELLDVLRRNAPEKPLEKKQL